MNDNNLPWTGFCVSPTISRAAHSALSTSLQAIITAAPVVYTKVFDLLYEVCK